jgi:hypothetical protein
MKVRFVGPRVVRRVVGELVWGEETGFVQEVPVGLAASLLTAPRGRWAVEGKVSAEEVGQLAEVLGIDRVAAEVFVEDMGGTVEQAWKEGGEDIGE